MSIQPSSHCPSVYEKFLVHFHLCECKCREEVRLVNLCAGVTRPKGNKVYL